MHYLSANSLETALEALTREEFTIVAGGTDWFPALGGRPAPQNILDITKIKEFQGIGREKAGWHIGAATRWCDVIAAKLPPCFDGLKAAAREVGSVQIQNAGTVVGNLCNASPAADGVPPLLTLDCQVEIASLAGRRRMGLNEFITGVRKTDLRRGELVSGLFIPQIAAKTGSCFLKLGSRAGLVISITMVSALIELDRHSRVASARIAVGACSPVAQRLPRLEQALAGLPLSALKAPDLVTPDFLTLLAPIDDVRGSRGFRLAAVAALCQRAVAAAAMGATG